MILVHLQFKNTIQKHTKTIPLKSSCTKCDVSVQIVFVRSSSWDGALYVGSQLELLSALHSRSEGTFLARRDKRNRRVLSVLLRASSLAKIHIS